MPTAPPTAPGTAPVAVGDAPGRAAPAGEPPSDGETRSGQGIADRRGPSASVRLVPLDARLPARLASRLRERVGGVLRATGVFRENEVAVALELYDESVGSRVAVRGSREPSPHASSRERRATNHESAYLFLGAVTGEGELVGYACYGPTPGADRVHDLYWIAVDPAHQGAGVGTILLDEVERRLRRLRARVLIVETSSRSDYAPTRRFYERRGYSEAARVRGFYAPDDDRIIYTKRFHSPVGRERGRDE